MRDWALPHLTDYWDSRVDAIDNLSRALAEVPEAQQQEQLSSLSAAVKHHARVLSNADLIKFTIPVLEDLYKAAAKATVMGMALEQRHLKYVAATGRPFFRALTERGYMAHYVIDNTWSTLIGPIGTLPMWFELAGLQYICPQFIACRQFENDRPVEEWPALIDKHIEAGRQAAAERVKRCHAAGLHFVYLDIDATDLEFALRLSGEPGVIFVFRQEALVPGSRCVINTPDRPRPSPVPQVGSRRVDSPDAPYTPPSADELHDLLNRFLHRNQEERKFHRSVLRGLIVQHIAALPAGADLVEVKGILVKFHGVSAEIMNIDEAHATLGEALNTVLDAIDLTPQMATLLPVVLDERTKGMTQDPFLRANDFWPSFPALLKAVRRAEELSAR